MTNFSKVKIEIERNDNIYYGQFAQIDRADFGMYDNHAKSSFGTLNIGLTGMGGESGLLPTIFSTTIGVLKRASMKIWAVVWSLL